MDVTELAAAFVVEVVLARHGARGAGGEQAHRRAAMAHAAELARRLPNRPMDVSKLSTAILGGVNWKNCVDALDLAGSNLRMYDRCLEVAAAEITDDPRLDEAKAEQLILRATAHLSHIAGSGKKRGELVRD